LAVEAVAVLLVATTNIQLQVDQAAVALMVKVE
jgi:hypothetical protein